MYICMCIYIYIYIMNKPNFFFHTMVVIMSEGCRED